MEYKISNVSALLERFIAHRWIAGPYIDDALSRARSFENYNIKALINYLGEDFSDKKDVNTTMHVYYKLIEYINKYKLNSSLSIKPTQIGLHIDKEYAISNYRLLLRKAKKYNIFVWLDMEYYTDVDSTINMYLKYVNLNNTGICIQSALERSIEDVKKIVKKNGTIRLVKGAYSGDIYLNRSDATKEFKDLMKYLFNNSKRFMIATHDKELIRLAIKMNKRFNRNLSFGFLNGIIDSYAISLAKSENVYVYIPFGERWIDYTIRRMKEMHNIMLILHSIFSRGSSIN